MGRPTGWQIFWALVAVAIIVTILEIADAVR